MFLCFLEINVCFTDEPFQVWHMWNCFFIFWKYHAQKKKPNNLFKLHCETLQRRKTPTHLNVLQPLKLNMTWFSQVKPRKGGKHSKNCWICHTCFSEHPYSCGNECSHYRFLQYLHTGKLSRYFLRWLVLILGNQQW